MDDLPLYRAVRRGDPDYLDFLIAFETGSDLEPPDEEDPD